MGLFGKGNTLNMVHYEGIPSFNSGYAITMELCEESKKLIFKARAFKNLNPVELSLNKVKRAGLVNVEEIGQQSKLGRAAVGGILFGGAGAIVGALSAGEKKKIKTLYIINYVSDDEEKAIVLRENGNPNLFRFQKQLDSLLPKHESQQGNIVL